ncbi:hypothetical protein B0H13DRAFT_1889961 [Mycena leptocephala]|nr:hypothetical protein B0H13DRAFT_1889961 [Mycena leptocephala]
MGSCDELGIIQPEKVGDNLLVTNADMEAVQVLRAAGGEDQERGTIRGVVAILDEKRLSIVRLALGTSCDVSYLEGGHSKNLILDKANPIVVRTGDRSRANEIL